MKDCDPSLQAFQFGAAQGYQALADAVRELGADNPFTRLVPDLSGASGQGTE